jgi:predicted amidophosphoribosyltransferase
VSVLAALADLVFPRRCVGCGSHLGVLCPQCLPIGPVRRGADGTWCAARYDGAVRAALLAYKERGRRDLADPLGRLLARSVAAGWAAEQSTNSRVGAERVVLVPAPSARSVAAARGGDHLLRLARRAGTRCGLRTAPGTLAFVRSVRDSAGLGVADRAANLADAVIARPPPDGVAALVVDDIVTTGATLRECVRALREAGWPVIGTAVIASTPRRARGPFGPLAEHSETV